MMIDNEIKLGEMRLGDVAYSLLKELVIANRLTNSEKFIEIIS